MRSIARPAQNLLMQAELLTAQTALLWTLIGILSATVLYYRLRAGSERRMELHQRQEDDRIRRLALYDGGTMMRNRASFQQEFVQLIQRSERAEGRFDLFHARLQFAGLETSAEIDEAMQKLAERIAPLMRHGDLLARYSTTELAVLRPQLHEADAPRQLREQMLAACMFPIQVGDYEIQAKAQVGTSRFPEDGRHSRLLLEAAARNAGPGLRLPTLISEHGLRVA